MLLQRAEKQRKCTDVASYSTALFAGLRIAEASWSDTLFRNGLEQDRDVGRAEQGVEWQGRSVDKLRKQWK